MINIICTEGKYLCFEPKLTRNKTDTYIAICMYNHIQRELQCIIQSLFCDLSKRIIIPIAIGIIILLD